MVVFGIINLCGWSPLATSIQVCRLAQSCWQICKNYILAGKTEKYCHDYSKKEQAQVYAPGLQMKVANNITQFCKVSGKSNSSYFQHFQRIVEKNVGNFLGVMKPLRIHKRWRISSKSICNRVLFKGLHSIMIIFHIPGWVEFYGSELWLFVEQDPPWGLLSTTTAVFTAMSNIVMSICCAHDRWSSLLYSSTDPIVSSQRSKSQPAVISLIDLKAAWMIWKIWYLGLPCMFGCFLRPLLRVRHRTSPCWKYLTTSPQPV